MFKIASGTSSFAARTTARRSSGSPTRARHVSAARSETGDLALLYLYLPVGGEVTLKPGALPPDLNGEWFAPRTGQRKPAERIDKDLLPRGSRRSPLLGRR